jgi:DNA-binding CsgD family transcriptional regulator
MYWDRILQEVVNKNKNKDNGRAQGGCQGVVNGRCVRSDSNYSSSSIGRRDGVCATVFSNIGNECVQGVPRSPFSAVNSQSPRARKGNKSYNLGTKYGGVYFTQREAECMILLLQGKTISKIALALQLSPRTVEYYLQNMKKKVSCRTKSELIGLVLDSEFLQNIETSMVNLS